MSDFELNSNESETDASDEELQEAFAAGLIKPGLNTVQTKKQYVNNVKGLNLKKSEIQLNLPWIETLDSINELAPLAPEFAAQIQEQEEKRENQLKNNKKLPQIAPESDPVLNDFKREMLFHRQAQATVLKCIPTLKELGLSIQRPDDYFAEMAKSDEHMQKIREKLMQKQAQQQRSERVKQLRMQRKEGKALQIQAKFERQKEKKQLMDQVKKVRKGLSNDTSFLDAKHKNQNVKKLSKKALEKRRFKDKKFGFGGKKKGLKRNTKDSAADITEYKKPGKAKKFASKAKRPGKNRRQKNKNRK